jgi:hypothetical protein
VRRADDDTNAGSRESLQDRNRHLRRWRSVVDAWEEVAVDVDHAAGDRRSAPAVKYGRGL